MKKYFFSFAILLLLSSVTKSQTMDYPLKVEIFGANVYTYSKSSDGLLKVCKYLWTTPVWEYEHIEPEFSDAFVYDLVEGDNGNVYVTGKIIENGDYKTFLLNITNSGKREWVRYLDYSPNDEGGLALCYNNGEIYFTGFLTNGLDQKDVLINRYNVLGNQSWEQSLAYNFNTDFSNDIGSEILVDDNFVYICGTTNTETSNSEDIFMMTVAKDGGVIEQPIICERPFTNEYPTNFIFNTNNEGTSLQKNKTTVLGYIDNASTGNKDYLVTLFDGGLITNLLWQWTYEGTMDDVCAKGILSSDSNIISTGFVQKSSYDYDFATIKHNVNDSGKPMWENQIVFYPDNVFKTNSKDMASSISRKANKIYVGGFSETALNQFAIQLIIDRNTTIHTSDKILYSPDFLYQYVPGNFKMKTFLNVDETTGDLLAVFSKANIYDEMDVDYAIVRFDSSGGIISSSENNLGRSVNLSGTNIKNNLTELKTFPNPFNPETNIEFNLNTASFVSIKIYDMLGREVFTVNEKKPVGRNRIIFNANNLSSGVYYLKFSTLNYEQTMRLMLLK